MKSNTNAPDYWLNWRFLLSGICILLAMVISAILIWKFEGHKRSRNQKNNNVEECLYEDEGWRTCSKSIHPVWLLVYRILAFGLLLISLLFDAILHSGRIFYFYTEWTYTLVTIYFALGSAFSIYRCIYEYYQEKDNCIVTDLERGSYIAPKLGEDKDIPSKTGNLIEFSESNRKTGSVLVYALQIIFQICAGAVLLTDLVFWLILYPALQDPLTFLIVCVHSVNGILLLGDAILNQLRFPFFRIAYFILWTCVFVIFQWISHACVSIWWPYPFLDLSSPYAPLWYLGLGLLHGPCFGVFAIIYKIKEWVISR